MSFTQIPSFQKIAQRSGAFYLEPRYAPKKAGFHLAFAYAHLDGMTGVSR
jgi:hypothetical protein